ncbi:m-AAA protease-interacting protein 1, mitochondrial [Neocloeon triangulifer]|uniref:m-AAA protease-interacting protein 1, mitochondrial n=1 Tax=Neocloeon triangulifer TaxID=2078957 RepID=UPI00286F2761|nr:m-AAA protease-interacting protein 1, mitochondrial [Neocloeon triangulifer]
MVGATALFSAGRVANFAVSAARNRHAERILSCSVRSFSLLRTSSLLSKRIGTQSLLSPEARNVAPNTSRGYCDERPSPKLMEFPQVLWPSIFKVIKNWIMAKFVITPYFDRDFDLREFGEASQQAVEHVSQQLSKNNLDSLQGLVSREALVEIRSSLSRFSVQQLSEIAVNKNDIYFCFPHEVGVMFDDEEESQKRYVEITMVYFLMKGLADYKTQHGQPPDFNALRAAENQDKLFVLNYRFIREFTKGVSPDWTINMLNHYKGRPN